MNSPKAEYKEREGGLSYALGIVWTLARKDLLLEYRNRDVILSIAGLALLILTVFVLSIDLTPTVVLSVGAGVLWASIALAGVTGLSRTFALEIEQQTLSGLLLAPISRDIIFLGKAFGNFIFLTIAELIVIPVFALLFNLPILRLEIVLICVLFNLGFSSVGTLFAVISVNARAKEIMLPLLFLPTIAPILIASTGATNIVFTEGSWVAMGSWLGLVGAFDAVFLIATTILFPLVTEE